MAKRFNVLQDLIKNSNLQIATEDSSEGSTENIDKETAELDSLVDGSIKDKKHDDEVSDEIKKENEDEESSVDDTDTEPASDEDQSKEDKEDAPTEEEKAQKKEEDDIEKDIDEAVESFKSFVSGHEFNNVSQEGLGEIMSSFGKKIKNIGGKIIHWFKTTKYERLIERLEALDKNTKFEVDVPFKMQVKGKLFDASIIPTLKKLSETTLELCSTDLKKLAKEGEGDSKKALSLISAWNKRAIASVKGYNGFGNSTVSYKLGESRGGVEIIEDMHPVYGSKDSSHMTLTQQQALACAKLGIEFEKIFDKHIALFETFSYDIFEEKINEDKTVNEKYLNVIGEFRSSPYEFANGVWLCLYDGFVALKALYKLLDPMVTKLEKQAKKSQATESYSRKRADRLSLEIAAMEEMIDQAVVSLTELAQQKEVLQDGVDNGEGVSPLVAEMVSKKIDETVNNGGALVQKAAEDVVVIPATESFSLKSNRLGLTKVCLEAQEGLIKKVIDKIKAAIKWIVEKITQFLNFVKKSFSSTEKKVEETAKEVKKAPKETVFEFTYNPKDIQKESNTLYVKVPKEILIKDENGELRLIDRDDFKDLREFIKTLDSEKDNTSLREKVVKDIQAIGEDDSFSQKLESDEVSIFLLQHVMSVVKELKTYTDDLDNYNKALSAVPAKIAKELNDNDIDNETAENYTKLYNSIKNDIAFLSSYILKTYSAVEFVLKQINTNLEKQKKDNTATEAYTAIEINQQYRTIVSLEEMIQDSFDSVDQLDRIADKIEQAQDQGGLSETAASLVSEATDQAMQLVGYDSEEAQEVTNMPAVENFKGASSRLHYNRLALEAVENGKKSILKTIKDALVAFFKKIVEYIKSTAKFFNMTALKAKTFVKWCSKDFDKKKSITVSVENPYMQVSEGQSVEKASVASLEAAMKLPSDFDSNVKSGIDSFQKGIKDLESAGKVDAKEIFKDSIQSSAMSTFVTQLEKSAGIEELSFDNGAPIKLIETKKPFTWSVDEIKKGCELIIKNQDSVTNAEKVLSLAQSVFDKLTGDDSEEAIKISQTFFMKLGSIASGITNNAAHVRRGIVETSTALVKEEMKRETQTA